MRNSLPSSCSWEHNVFNALSCWLLSFVVTGVRASAFPEPGGLEGCLNWTCWCLRQENLSGCQSSLSTSTNFNCRWQCTSTVYVPMFHTVEQVHAWQTLISDFWASTMFVKWICFPGTGLSPHRNPVSSLDSASIPPDEAPAWGIWEEILHVGGIPGWGPLETGSSGAHYICRRQI